MTYKFKSKATGDLIMLEPDGRRLLEIIGKDAGSTGIILPDQIAAAVHALQGALESEEAKHRALTDTATAAGDGAHEFEVSLRQRAAPFIDMLRRCGEEGTEIVWGV
jgi:hypothetical protein